VRQIAEEVFMKLVIASDLHFGDPTCTLALDRFARTDRFVECFGGDCDYLVLLGDIFDIAVVDYRTAFSVARQFFERLRALEVKINRSIVYVPGNHDFDLWDTFQRQHNIIGQVTEKEQKIRAFQWSIPGVFDESKQQFILPGVPGDPERYDVEFLHHLTGHRVALSFPNLYFVHRDRSCDLLTHGHYFDGVWAGLGNACAAVNNPAMRIEDPANLAVAELVQLNFPLNQLTCTGVGQSGHFTDYVRSLQQALYGKDYICVNPDLRRLIFHLFGPRDTLWKKIWKSPLATLAYMIARILIRFSPSPPDMEHYLEQVHEQVCGYLQTSAKEMRNLEEIPVDTISRVIFGHTHNPIPADAPLIVHTAQGEIPFSNTGGWLTESKGAQIHIYEDGTLRSIRCE